QLKLDRTTTSKKQYKRFLTALGKSLLMNRIRVSYGNEQEDYYDYRYQYKDSLNNISKSNDLEYVWEKGLNFPLPKHVFSSIFENKKLNENQTKLLSQLKQNNFPLFTVVNSDKKMIIAEPSEQLISNQGVIDQLYQWYSNKFLCQEDHRLSYQALFFTNPLDALEYKNHIEYKNDKYKLVSNSNNLYVFPSSLDFYYKLITKNQVKVQFNVIPDLKELGNLVYKYQYKNNLFFHKKQAYSECSFQGQPIYLIQPIFVKHKYTNQVKKIEYFYEVKNSNINQDYKAIFVNYEIALLAWQKFIQKYSDYKMPYKPQVLVYNLEDYLGDYVKDNKSQSNRILFVPGLESYQFLQSGIGFAQTTIIEKCADILVYLKVCFKRMIWSLTSKQPVNF
ncbi:hypothetical protein, partial [Bacillus paranthracis]|uniref:hypothetical protein n=1 Tax=Bacillus paranthracis TaxID=2026186 RepID=UPI003D655751